MSDVFFSVDIDAATKRRAEIISERLGLTLSEAIGIFLHKYNEVGGFPFELKNSQAAEDAADLIELEEAIANDSGKRVTIDDLRKELDL
ncbi:MAG: type II toxin-antitoxin system RelB/DinJ family antitoxin [Bifidobacteriaceae bacterium]|nr:type II toxin-antitoxin system RelB/DinJ family antitoxin [Bifidobacteriaceae bacterium]